MADYTEYKIGDHEAYKRIAQAPALHRKMCVNAMDFLLCLRGTGSAGYKASMWGAFFEEMQDALSKAWPKASREVAEIYNSSFSVTRLTALFFENTRGVKYVDFVSFFYAVPPSRRRFLPKKYPDAAREYPPVEKAAQQSQHAAAQIAAQPTKEIEMNDSKDARCTGSISGRIDMNAPAVKARTEVFGRDVKDYTDEQVLQLIHSLEEQISQYETLKTRPKRIQATIEKLKKDLADVVAAFDAA